MIEMRVGEQHAADFRRDDRQATMIERFERPRSLEESAIYQQLAAVMRYFDARSRDRARGAMKAKFDHATLGRAGRRKAYS